jgi:riboflavin synthase
MPEAFRREQAADRVDQADGQAEFSINLIPHTVENTALGDLAAGVRVNLEVDLIARYVERMLTAEGKLPG